MNFAEVTGVTIPEGNVIKIEIDGTAVWEPDVGPKWTISLAPPLGSYRGFGRSASNGEYAIIAGGRLYSPSSGNPGVDAYDRFLTKYDVENLSVGMRGHAGSNVGDYVIFAGGQYSGNSDVIKAANAYDKNLTKFNCPDLGVARSALAASKTANHVIFAGGRTNINISSQSSIDVYDASLTRSMASDLNKKVEDLASASFNGRAIFAGGYSNTSASQIMWHGVDSYTDSLEQNVLDYLSTRRQYFSGASTENDVIFYCGESTSYTYPASVDAYDSNFSHTVLANSPFAVYNTSGISYKNMAIFSNGATGSSENILDITAYGPDLELSVLPIKFSESKRYTSPVQIGEYVLFPGGETYTADRKYSNIVEVLSYS